MDELSVLSISLSIASLGIFFFSKPRWWFFHQWNQYATWIYQHQHVPQVMGSIRYVLFKTTGTPDWTCPRKL